MGIIGHRMKRGVKYITSIEGEWLKRRKEGGVKDTERNDLY